jgi:hypothetical protein
MKWIDQVSWAIGQRLANLQERVEDSKPYNSLRWNYLCVKYGLLNLWRFRSVVWHFDNCDYSPLLKLLQLATRQMSDHHKRSGRVVGSDKIARQLLIVSELCRRLERDQYFENAGYKRKDWKAKSPHRRSGIIEHAEYLQKQDLNYLGRTLQHLPKWWD